MASSSGLVGSSNVRGRTADVATKRRVVKGTVIKLQKKMKKNMNKFDAKPGNRELNLQWKLRLLNDENLNDFFLEKFG